jgi:site-specific DNA-cytosine methylase
MILTLIIIIMKVLLACEESQIVCKEFRKLGHEAYSNDIQECSGGHPEWHLQMDVFEAIKLKQWDLMIAFPPCTYLSNAGIRWFNEDRYGDKARERKVLRLKAMEFVNKVYNSDIPKICIENPVGYLNVNWKKPTQIIQPYYFGDEFSKRTCLFLKNLSELKHNKNEWSGKGEFVYHERNGKVRANPKWYYIDAIKLPQKERALFRSKTFPGIAKAMAKQWGI